MNDSQTIRQEVIDRLVMRHGLSLTQAESVWDRCRLELLAVCIKRRDCGEQIEEN